MYLAEHVRVGVVLQQYRGGACVVVSCSNVQRRESDLALGAVVDEQRHNVFMTLLEGYCQGSEAILRTERTKDETDVLRDDTGKDVMSHSATQFMKASKETLTDTSLLVTVT